MFALFSIHLNHFYIIMGVGYGEFATLLVVLPKIALIFTSIIRSAKQLASARV